MHEDSLQLKLRAGLFEEIDLCDSIMGGIQEASVAWKAQPSVPAPTDQRAGSLGQLLKDALFEPVDLSEDIFLSLALQDSLHEPIDLSEDILLSLALKEALSEQVDLQKEVMVAATLSDALRAPVDLADEVMLSLTLQESLQETHDFSDDIMLSLALQDNLKEPIDFSDQIFAALAPTQPVEEKTDPKLPRIVPNQDAMVALRDVLTEQVDFSDAIMQSIQALPEKSMERPTLRVVQGGNAPQPLWRRVARWSPAVLAIAAAALLVIELPSWLNTVPLPEQTAMTAFPIETRNIAEVEDLSTAATATAQVMQFDEMPRPSSLSMRAMPPPRCPCDAELPSDPSSAAGSSSGAGSSRKPSCTGCSGPNPAGDH